MQDETKALTARVKMRYQRGGSYAQYLQLPLIAVGVLKQFDVTIQGWGVPMLPLYLMALVGSPITFYIIGHLDEFFGIWKHENNVSWFLTPVATTLCHDSKESRQNTEKMDAKLDAIDRRLGDIEKTLKERDYNVRMEEIRH